jgi:hypothetical protein
MFGKKINNVVENSKRVVYDKKEWNGFIIRNRDSIIDQMYRIFNKFN